jgi:hypothetical protein
MVEELNWLFLELVRRLQALNPQLSEMEQEQFREELRAKLKPLLPLELSEQGQAQILPVFEEFVRKLEAREAQLEARQVLH